MMGIMKYDAGCGENKNWLVSESAFDERYLGKCEALFAQGNGYLGVRNASTCRFSLWISSTKRMSPS